MAQGRGKRSAERHLELPGSQFGALEDRRSAGACSSPTHSDWDPAESAPKSGFRP